jgi:predicted transcriptional regulator of viral defense system
MTRHSRLLSGLVLVAGLASGSCGYSLVGRGVFLPAHIQAIGIPLFVNHTTVFEIEQRLTERVRSEFIGRGRYRVQPDSAGVDAVLLGQISSISIVPASFTGQQQAARYVFTLISRIEFRDLTNDEVIWENPSLQFREEYEVTAAGDVLDPNVFFGQESNAVDRIAADFAKTVVSSILEAF